MENIRNRVDIKLCSNEHKVEKLIARPNFESRTTFAENMAVIHMKRLRFYLTKNVYRYVNFPYFKKLHV
jgi:hypothetical protein